MSLSLQAKTGRGYIISLLMVILVQVNKFLLSFQGREINTKHQQQTSIWTVDS